MDINRRSLLATSAAALPSAAIGATAGDSSKALGCNVMAYGAKGDGIHDDTLAMMRAHRGGEVVFYPPGRYRFSRVVIARGGMEGVGQATHLAPFGDDDRPRIHYTGDSGNAGNAPRFARFLLDGRATVRPAVGLKLMSDTGFQPQSDAVIDAVAFVGLADCLDSTHASGWRIINCSFYGYSSTGIIVGNPSHPDVGDSLVSNCQFLTDQRFAKAVAIRQSSSGGLKVIGNKFNAGASAYKMSLEGTTSIFIFTGNSVENCAGPGLVFENNFNTKLLPVRFDQIIIGNNQFANNLYSVLFKPINQYEDTSYWDIVSITGNTFKSEGNEPTITVDTARYMALTGNVFWGGGSPIVATRSCLNVKVDNVQSSSVGAIVRN